MTGKLSHEKIFKRPGNQEIDEIKINADSVRQRKAKRVSTLLAGYMRNTLTRDEHDELDEWVGASDKNMKLFEELTDERRVEIALDLLNDNPTKLTTRLTNDQQFVYKKTWWERIIHLFHR